MRIDVWSDVVCPWCYIGFTRLEQAIAESGIEAEVYHHAYQLDPSATSTGRRTVEVLAEKYGIGVEDAAGMMAQVTDVARTVGLEYQLENTMHGNTQAAHRLLAYAAEEGKQHDLLFRLFDTYFVKTGDVFADDALKSHAVAVGLDEAAVNEVLSSDAFADVVEYDKQLADQIGVRGVPFFVFDQRIAVAGAESVDVMKQAIAKAAVPAE